MKDYYKILGVEKNATPEQLKKAFHKLAHQHHPDKAHGNTEKFKEINEAYQVLSNAQKRENYDRFGSAEAGGFGNYSGFNNADFAGGFNINMDNLGDIFGGFSDIFGFGGSKKSTRNRRGRDLHFSLSLDFLEAVFGVNKEIKLERQISCGACAGSGAEAGSQTKTCSACQGAGHVNRVQRTFLGNIQTSVTCEQCHGEGQMIEKKCRHCSGSGLTKEEKILTIKIPAGIDDGETIRLTGQGEITTKNGQAGDLYLKISVRAHQSFQRDGANILTKKEISFSQAALGAKVEVQTINGPVDLKIPAGTVSGKIFILREQGITRLNSRGKGDQYVEVVIKVPEKLSREQKKLLEDLDKLN